MSQYDYTKTPVSLDRLTQEVQQSAIVTALDHMTYSGTTVSIYFKADLSDGDQTILAALVTAHTGVPLPQNTSAPVAITSQPDPVPFAQPLYRTKRDATDAWVTCPANTDTAQDFKLLAERYVSGGDLLIKDAQEGDYVTAEVHDTDSLIPSPCRAALCEAWPMVASYITKMWIEPKTGYQTVQIDTYPLNAKITAGLYLRVTYHATADTGDRKMSVNYHLTKKL